jgi:hypothetical protein
MSGPYNQAMDKAVARDTINELDVSTDTWAFRMARLLFLEDEIREETNIWRKVSCIF